MKPNIDRRITALRLAVYLGGAIPFAWLLWDSYTGRLGVDPIQLATRRTGLTALIFLILSLAMTPLEIITGYTQWIRLRRPLGLYSFFYAAVHLAIFVAIDYNFAWNLIWLDSVDKRYIWVGLAAFLILAAMAFTSFDFWKKTLRKNWKRLHRLVYLAVILVTLHFAWAVKGDLKTLSGEVIQPVLYGLVILVLLVVRIKAVRKAIVRQRELRKQPRKEEPRKVDPQDLPGLGRG
ncbi:MAG TPA: protein-methionine-sulfoxide reductase heme-binding subunit MsrQ [Anaerolineaceae bacterium]|nr:protein-methionine-sulfoxide reductase heme-binding subunit MsrQ [Anaerolineaceae bacterium]